MRTGNYRRKPEPPVANVLGVVWISLVPLGPGTDLIFIISMIVVTVLLTLILATMFVLSVYAVSAVSLWQLFATPKAVPQG